MLLYFLAFVGGVLTIVSPCILPVLPFVFSRADQPFRRSGLPLLAGMAATFAVVAGIATFAGAWIVRANQIGRILAIIVFALLGLALFFPVFGTRDVHGIIVGSVRRADFGFDFDGSGDTRAKRAHNFSAAVVFRGRCNFAGYGTSGRK